MATLELRVNRVESDAQGEKRTREQLTVDLNTRLRSLERAWYTGLGALGALQIVLGIVLWYFSNHK